MKGFSLGIVIGGLVVLGVLLIMGSGDYARATNLEKAIYREVADRQGQLVLTGDANGDFIVINKETGVARRVVYEGVNRGSCTVKFGSYCGDSVGFVVPSNR